MEADLLKRLLTNAGVAAIAGTRMAWLERPSGGLPAVTLQTISPGRTYDHDGAINLTGPRIQFDCWGRSALEASLLSKAVVAAIEPSGTQGSTKFFQSFQTGGRDLSPEDLPGGGKAFRRSLDFTVWNQPV